MIRLLALATLMSGLLTGTAVAQKANPDLFDQVRQQLWQEMESTTATPEQQFFAVWHLMRAESERGNHAEALKLLKRHKELGGDPRHFDDRLHLEQSLLFAQTGDIPKTVAELNKIEPERYRIETALSAATCRIRADDVDGARAIANSLVLSGQFEQARERNLLPWIDLLIANRLAEQGQRMQALEQYTRVMEAMQDREQVIIWTQLPTFGVRRVSQDMMDHGFVEEAIRWPIDDIYNDTQQKQLGYYAPELVAQDLLARGHSDLAWELHTSIDDLHRRAYLMAMVARHLSNNRARRMDADDRFRQTTSYIRDNQVDPSNSLVALLVETAWQLEDQEQARQMVSDQARQMETLERDKRHYDHLIDLYLAVEDPDSAEEVLTGLLSSGHQVDEACKIGIYRFAQNETDRAHELVQMADRLTATASTGAAVGGRGMPVMRSDNFQRAVVALHWLEMQEFEKAAALLGQTTQASRHKAVYGISSVNKLTWNDAMIRQWLEAVRPDERLHALAGIYVAMDKQIGKPSTASEK